MLEAEVKPEVETKQNLNITSKDGQLLYTTTQEELDECFYSIIGLMSFTKTFNVGSKLKLTYTTITDDQKMKLLKSMKEWAGSNDASSTMFDQMLNKLNLANYLSYIEMNGDGINLREKDLDKRLEYLGSMAEGALQLYGTYEFVFLEIIRMALLSQVSLKNF